MTIVVYFNHFDPNNTVLSFHIPEILVWRCRDLWVTDRHLWECLTKNDQISKWIFWHRGSAIENEPLLVKRAFRYWFLRRFITCFDLVGTSSERFHHVDVLTGAINPLACHWLLQVTCPILIGRSRNFPSLGPKNWLNSRQMPKDGRQT